MPDPIRICIADDHRLMLEGLATLVESIDGFQLVGKFESGTRLLSGLREMSQLPQVCIVDIEMPELDGVETTRRIKSEFPPVKVMALTMHQESHFASKMIAAGANAYLLKNVDRETFITSIRKIVETEAFISEGLAFDRSTSEGETLTSREKEILKRIVAGKTNKEIGKELFISDRTADTHRTNIKKKLKLNTLAQLIQYAKENGLYS